MIIREDKDFIILIGQHDHGILSGEIAFNWGNKDFSNASFEQILAATYHDFAWYEKDLQIIWNEDKTMPYDFVNYPTKEKLHIYHKGITQLEKLHPYVALITSLHYCSFFLGRNNTEYQEFVASETERQEKLAQSTKARDVKDDLQFLKLCDDISLYACLNKPGVSKGEEHPWYQNGIAWGKKENENMFQLRWLSETDIEIRPFPFKREWQTTIPYKLLCKKTKQIVKENELQISFR
jgi:hypothetical protein